MPKAIWNGVVVAESDQIEVVEGNLYFPPESVKKEFLKPSQTTSRCPWKGTASYYHVEVNGEIAEDAAWYYPTPNEAAQKLANYVAFWRGVDVEG